MSNEDFRTRWIEHFRSEYAQWWHPKLEQFPVGWTDTLADFFRALDWPNSAVTQQKIWVMVHFEQSEIGPWTVYISPAVMIKDWSDDDLRKVFQAVEKIIFAMSRTCEICGVFDGIPRLQPKSERILCEEHRHA